MMEYQFQQLLETMKAGLNPFKSEATFARPPGKGSTEKGMDYAIAKGIKL